MRISNTTAIALDFTNWVWKKRQQQHHYNLPNMRISTSVVLMFFVALGIIFMSVYQPAHLFGMEYEVRVINGFTNNSSLPLVIWCISQQDGDMGGRALQEGDDYGWRLKTNIWRNSNYLCTLKWDAVRRSFDAFKIPRDSQRCAPLNKCSWLVKEDGFYFSSDEIVWKKDFSWY